MMKSHSEVLRAEEEVTKVIGNEEVTLDAVESLVAAVAAAGTLRRPQLTQIPELRALRPRQIETLLETALGDGRLVEDGEDIRTGMQSDPGDPKEGSSSDAAPRPWRVVAIDFEAIVRPISKAPYLERHPYQIAGLRLGRDHGWVSSHESLSLFCELPTDSEQVSWRIDVPEIAVRHAAAALPRERWLSDLDDLLRGADAVVAYNGDSMDFPLLEEERRLAGLPPLPAIEKIDGLRLAVSMWPNPPRNARLGDLAERLGIDLTGLTWHEALSDCRILAAVCEAAGQALASMDPTFAELIFSVAGDSPTWAFVAELGGVVGPPREFSPDEVVDILGEGLEARGTPRRRERHPFAIKLEDSLLLDGRVDPQRLAELLHEHAPVRPSQGAMSQHISAWLRDGRGGLVESPTGTGKSLVLLAAALDWISADPGNQLSLPPTLASSRANLPKTSKHSVRTASNP